MGCLNSVPTLMDGEGGEDGAGDGSGPDGRARTSSILPDIPLRREQITNSVQSFLTAERARPRVAIGSFRDVQKRRTLHEVIHAFTNPSGQPFVLILDRLGAAVLSTQLSMSDIMFPEGPVALLENLSKKRQPCPTMEAVYFIAPTKQSLTLLLADFAEKDEAQQAMYKGAHFVFTSTLPPEGIGMMRKTPRLLRRMISFREVQADIFPLESHVVNFGLVGSLSRLFGHGHMNPLNKDSQSLYEDIASRLVSVCVTLNEAPMIRFKANNARSKLICEAFASRMLGYMRSHEDFVFNHANGESEIPERATLLIYDRREDLSSPLLHEFTYQAMCMDVLESEVIVGQGQTSFEYSTRDKGVDTKVMFNNTAKDDIWRIHRHYHIAEMPSLLAGWNKAFRESENYKLLKNARKLTRPRDQMKLLRTKDHTSELVEMYARHRLVAGKLMEYATANSDSQTDLPLMFQISEVEGQITTGLDGDSGKALGDEKVRQNLCDLLGKFEVQIDTKVRLVTLWFIHYGVKFSQDAHRVVWDACDPALPAKRIAQIGQLLYMKVPMNNHGRTGTEKKEWKQRRAEVQRRAAAIQKANTRSTRVHEPNLARVVDAHISTVLTTEEYCWRDVNRAPDPNGDLDPEEAPQWYRPGTFGTGSLRRRGDGTESGLAADGKTLRKGRKKRGSMETVKGGGARSLRKHKIGIGTTGLRFGAKGSSARSSGSYDSGGAAGGGGSGRGAGSGGIHDSGGMGGGTGDAGKAGGGGQGEPAVGDSGFKFEGPRIIVAVFGGITYAEMRSMYEIMAKTRREIIVCCTDIVTPNMFMQSLGSMGAPEMSSGEDSSSSSSSSSGGDSGSDDSVGLDDVELQ